LFAMAPVTLAEKATELYIPMGKSHRTHNDLSGPQ
jgi:hypothetical protein